jgi:hypothetical protein
MFPNIWFNDEDTKAGREALGWYHEKKDDVRNIGLGPCHDWSSNGADSFGLMCVVAESHSGHGSEWWHDWKTPVNSRGHAKEDTYGHGYRRRA